MAKKGGPKDRFYEECFSAFSGIGDVESADEEYAKMIEKQIDDFEKKHKVGKYAEE
jgi:hypothetical protein